MALIPPMAAGLEYAGLARGTAFGVAAAADAASWAPLAYGAYRYYAGSSNRDSAAMDGGYIQQGHGKRHRTGYGPRNPGMRKKNRFIGPMV